MMLGVHVFSKDGPRLCWDPDEERSLAQARTHRKFGIILVVVILLLFGTFPGLYPLWLVLLLIAIVILRDGKGYATRRSQIVIDTQSQVIRYRSWELTTKDSRKSDKSNSQQSDATSEIPDSALSQEWSLNDFQAVAIACRSQVTVIKGNATCQVNDLIIRLLGSKGSMTLEVFQLREAESAHARAELIAKHIDLPLHRQSIRSDESLFHIEHSTKNLDQNTTPDNTIYVRTLSPEETDNSRDREIDREQWKPLEEPADLLAPPNTSFFL